MALPAAPNTDPNKGRPSTASPESEAMAKGIKDVEDTMVEQLQKIMEFTEIMKNYIPKLGFIDTHTRAIKLKADQIHKQNDQFQKEFHDEMDAILAAMESEENAEQVEELEQVPDAEQQGEQVKDEMAEVVNEEAEDTRDADDATTEILTDIARDVSDIATRMRDGDEDKRDPADNDGKKTGKGDDGKGKEVKKEQGAIGKTFKVITDFLKMLAKGFLIAGLLVGTLLTANEGMFSAIKNLFSKVFEVFSSIVGIIVEKVLPVFVNILTVVVDAVASFLPPVMSILEVVIDFVMGLIEGLMPILEIVLNVIGVVLSVIAMAFQAFADSGMMDIVMGTIYGFINMFIDTFNFIIEAVALLASLFGKGDEVRRLKVDRLEVVNSQRVDAVADRLDFSLSDAEIDKQIDAQVALGNLNDKEATKIRESKEEFKEEQDTKELDAAKRIYEMAEKQNIEAGSSEVTVEDQDGTSLVLMKNFKSIDGWRNNDEYLVDPVPNKNGSFTMYDPETGKRKGVSYTGKGGATTHIIATLAGAQGAKDEMAASESAETNMQDFFSDSASIKGNDLSDQTGDASDEQRAADAAASKGGDQNVNTAMSVSNQQNSSVKSTNITHEGGSPTTSRGFYVGAQ